MKVCEKCGAIMVRSEYLIDDWIDFEEIGRINFSAEIEIYYCEVCEHNEINAL